MTSEQDVRASETGRRYWLVCGVCHKAAELSEVDIAAVEDARAQPDIFSHFGTWRCGDCASKNEPFPEYMEFQKQHEQTQQFLEDHTLVNQDLAKFWSTQPCAVEKHSSCLDFVKDGKQINFDYRDVP